ncbi:hypothetical protein GCM10023350_12440 [Nocardioides endophyticus]|uniref:DUF7507 domain-containing protein n=1 Tax=Nocardioides endophyticus TaxID=1353775 RepID=A0ABP8YHY9_9ACTN
MVRVRALLTVAMFAVAGTAALPTPQTAAADRGGVFVTETFKNSTAQDEFEAFGSACLSGAPAVAAPLPGGAHDLAGCSTVTSVGPVPPPNADGRGFLQLTDASINQSGAVLFNHRIPAEQGLSVTFEQWQYGSTTTASGQRPADGIAFFLTRGSSSLTAPGAFGGSLGYAQKQPDSDSAQPFIPGVDQGYLGIGLDYLGNYFGDWERRGTGCSAAEGRSPAGTGFRVPEANKITVRGPGDGTDGYCFLDSTATRLGQTTPPWESTLPFSLRSEVDAVPADPAAAEEVLVPVRRTVTVTISPAPDPMVTIELSRGDNAVHRVLTFDAPRPVPEYYKFGFSGSTGSFTDVHLIRNVVLESVDPVPLLDLEKESTDPGPFRVGDVIRYVYRVTNTGFAPATRLGITDDHIDDVTCDVTTLPPVGSAPANTTECHGRYRVRQRDLDAGAVENVARAHADGGGAISPPADEIVEVVEDLPPPTRAAIDIDKEARDPGPFRLGEIVRYHYTVTNVGEVAVSSIRVADDHVEDVACDDSRVTVEPPGNVTHCTGRYRVTADDVRAKQVQNVARATGEGPGGGRVTSPPADEIVDVIGKVGPAPQPSPSPTVPPTPAASPRPDVAPHAGQPPPVDSGADGLPGTGAPANIGWLAPLGVAAVLLGAGLVLVGRRRGNRLDQGAPT